MSDTLLDRILSGVAWGAALAAMGCTADPESGSSPADAGPPALSPLPEPGCKSFGDACGCCESADCYEPPPGGDCLRPSDVIADPSESWRQVADALENANPIGCESGDYICSITGPYRPPADGASGLSGRCCYLVGEDCCEGRPLVSNGVVYLAATVSRADWT